MGDSDCLASYDEHGLQQRGRLADHPAGGEAGRYWQSFGSSAASEEVVCWIIMKKSVHRFEVVNIKSSPFFKNDKMIMINNADQCFSCQCNKTGFIPYLVLQAPVCVLSFVFLDSN